MTLHPTGSEADRLEAIRSLAAHDLREPIRKVRMFTERVERRVGGDLDERSAEDLRIVVRAATRLEGLVDRIAHLAGS